jgi:hypothetical protein
MPSVRILRSLCNLLHEFGVPVGEQRSGAALPSAAKATARLAACEPLPHFNEVDEGAAVDGLVTNRTVVENPGAVPAGDGRSVNVVE